MALALLLLSVLLSCQVLLWWAELTTEVELCQ